jgi:osmoprotectant transport system substrate-binding protein
VKNRTKLIRAIPALLVALGLTLLAACGNVGDSGGSEGGGGGPTVTVGSKNFTEQYILGELYAQALEANGFNVEKKLDLGSEQIAHKALENGQIDMYPEYTGTALVAIHGKEGEPPDTPKATYQQSKELYAQGDPALTMLTPAQFNNTYGIFVRSEVAEQDDLKTLADLAEVSPGLTFVSFSEFQNRSDGYPNMQKNYEGLDFMEDPKSIWPFYYPAPVVRSDVLEKNPKMEEVLNSVSETLDAETMRKLNAQVDIEQEEPDEVAAEYLKEQGLVE